MTSMIRWAFEFILLPCQNIEEATIKWMSGRVGLVRGNQVVDVSHYTVLF